MNKQTPMSQWKVKRLIKAGEDFNIPFHMPPFDGDVTEGFFDIHTFKKTKEFQDFLSIITSINVKYEYAFSKSSKKKIFMTIKMIDWKSKEYYATD